MPAVVNPNPYHSLYEEMLYPTVRISTPSGTGSGVVISYKLQVTSSKPETSNLQPETYILTAAHVVGDESRVTIEFFYPATAQIEAMVIITDTNKDLALLRALCDSVATAKLAPRNYTPYLFTPVYAVGCSLGLMSRPSQGIITSLGGLCGSVADNWEISAPILPGNSGGPVYDANTHELIGIAVWVRVYGGQLITTMGGVVPIQTVYEFLDSYPLRGLPIIGCPRNEVERGKKLQGVTESYKELPQPSCNIR